ncbi:hypothetical protein DPMN_166218 [Dreissena polymorpha]|uniref:Uncharacterized protein n=1 Tax=Dreissena polymorpha TaxID=45954 RepID=A0A9D4IXP4_DREPO|nr:hypothetical protein DPMN_166218 [Dreissena polymorpha]
MGPVGGIVRQNAQTAPRLHDIIVPEICITRTYLLKREQQKYFVWQEKNLKYLYNRVAKPLCIADHVTDETFLTLQFCPYKQLLQLLLKTRTHICLPKNLRMSQGRINEYLK